jgi:anti-sigma regulatory factor (Ser/Thr protein kinase)
MTPAASISNMRWVQQVSATEAGIAEARQRAVHALRWAGLDGQHLFFLELCLHEALVNALVHGVYEHGASHIRLSCDVYAGWVRVSVEDDGNRFDELSVETPRVDEHPKGGRGLFLIHTFMSRVIPLPSGGGICMELDLNRNVPSSFRSILPIEESRSGLAN